MKLPQIKHSDILIREIGKDLIVYDLQADRAYKLDTTAALIYNSCDGQTSFGELRRKHKLTDDVIHSAIHKFQTAGLIQKSKFPAPASNKIFRRNLIKNLSFAASCLFLTRFVTGCGGGDNDFRGMLPSGASPGSSSGSTPAAGQAGFVLVTFIDSRGGADNLTNTATCQNRAATECATRIARLVCTGPFNNTCACTCT